MAMMSGYDPKFNNGGMASSLALQDKPDAQRIRAANEARDRAVYAFLREFFIRLGTQFEPSDLINRANIYVARLYPEVTESNAAEYVKRTW